MSVVLSDRPQVRKKQKTEKGTVLFAEKGTVLINEKSDDKSQ